MVNKKKYTVNVAYTTPSGRMHIGHGLGHTISDVFLRYGALRKGKETFFGFGMHSTGKDLIKILTSLNEEEGLEESLKRYNLSREKRDKLLSLHDLPNQIDALVQEYREQYQRVIEEMGIAMNYDSFFSTNQESNQRYTQWTLRRLDEAGLIVETEADRPYCPKCDDIKHIDKDLSEVSTIGQVNWDEVRVSEGHIFGGEFECRLHSGEKIIVKKRKERAINYSDPEMQQKTVDLAKKMEVFPKRYQGELEKIIKTRMAKPFERKAEGNVGALSPFDLTKRVEALSDSNIYMEFYAISQLINQERLYPQNLTDEFFDYIYLDKGDPEKVARVSGLKKDYLEVIKENVEEIYPVDISVAGFEHMAVHLPFSLFNHAAVLQKKYFFPEYIITSHVTRDGEKMSKSKGNVVYLDEILESTRKAGKIEGLSEEASLDAVRFFLSYYQSLDKDFDWNDDNFRSSGLKGMRRYVSGIVKAGELLKRMEEKASDLFDRWFSTVDQRTIREITERMDEKDSRGALISLVDVRGRALSEYMTSQSHNPELLSRFVFNQINMGHPIMPRVVNELREKYFSEERLEWPLSNPNLEFPEEYEIVEHQFRGKGYKKSLSGEINSILGKMIGKKEISPGETAVIITPTKHQMQVLQSERIPLSKELNLEFSVDPTARGVEIRKRE